MMSVDLLLFIYLYVFPDWIWNPERKEATSRLELRAQRLLRAQLLDAPLLPRAGRGGGGQPGLGLRGSGHTYQLQIMKDAGFWQMFSQNCAKSLKSSIHFVSEVGR